MWIDKSGNTFSHESETVFSLSRSYSFLQVLQLGKLVDVISQYEDSVQIQDQLSIGLLGARFPLGSTAELLHMDDYTEKLREYVTFIQQPPIRDSLDKQIAQVWATMNQPYFPQILPPKPAGAPKNRFEKFQKKANNIIEYAVLASIDEKNYTYRASFYALLSIAIKNPKLCHADIFTSYDMVDFTLKHRETDQNCKTLLDTRFITTKETQKIKLLMIP